MIPQQAFEKTTGLTLEEGIKKAIEGGYPNLHFLDTATEGAGQYRVMLDPAFWKSLGKALGWQYSICDHAGCLKVFPCSCGNHDCACGKFHADPERPKTYLFYWHHFIDHLNEESHKEDTQ